MDINDPQVLHFPLPNQTYNIFRDFLFSKTNETSINHKSHQHPLILVVDTHYNDITLPMNKIEDYCNGCMRPIMAMPFYKCTLYDQGCSFALHEWCTRLPPKLKARNYHRKTHTLILLPKAPPTSLGSFKCAICDHHSNGFAYNCIECGVRYIVDVYCALLPRKITHKSHPGHLLVKVKKLRDNDYCRMCLSKFAYDNASYSCQRCNFHIHTECALLLPETARHKYDKHPMTLTYSPVENHEGDYFCEVCEEELNPNSSYYHCHECAQSLHIACADPLLPQGKPYIANGLTAKADSTNHDNVKFGVTYKIEDHPHRLLFVCGSEGDGDCTKCGDTLNKCHILKCLQCKFASHCRHHYNFDAHNRGYLRPWDPW